MIQQQISNSDLELYKEKAKFVRLETLRLVDIAKSGHYTSVFSCAELFSVLYYRILRVDPKNPKWEDRDRFILSKGHAAVGLYPILADLGFFDKSLLDTYTRIGSPFGDHPDMRKIPGIDFSSGSLGHGLSVAVGMALGGVLQAKDYRVYCLLGDGELNEGQVWEAAMAASHFRLGNLVAIVDRNGMSLDGNTEDIMAIEPIDAKFQAFGWEVVHVDGHDLVALCEVLDKAKARTADIPFLIIAHTVKGKGVSFMEGNPYWHLGYLAGEDLVRARQEILEGA